MTKPVTPLLTADVNIEMPMVDGKPVILIERKYEPYGWAIPGGFVDVGESLEQAAVREAAEESSWPVVRTALLGCYSDPSRDPRMHTASAVYIAEAGGTPRAADDAANVHIFPVDALPDALAFDHGVILADYLKYRQTGQCTPLRTETGN